MSNTPTVIEEYSESIPEQTIARKQQDLQDAQEYVKSSVPEIKEPEDNIVTLPRGIRSNGVWHTECEVKELTGADEEVLARQKGTSVFHSVLGLGVVRIGTLQLSEIPLVERQEILSHLLTGEQEQVFLAISRATYGDERTIRYVCPSVACQEPGEVPITLSKDIAIPAMADPYRTYEYTTSKGQKVEFRLVTGADQADAMLRPTAAEQNTVLLSECITLVDGTMVVDPLGFARDLSLRDRKAILETLNENQPNPDMAFTLDCPKCGFHITLEVAWGDIFLY